MARHQAWVSATLSRTSNSTCSGASPHVQAYPTHQAVCYNTGTRDPAVMGYNTSVVNKVELPFLPLDEVCGSYFPLQVVTMIVLHVYITSESIRWPWLASNDS